MKWLIALLAVPFLLPKKAGAQGSAPAAQNPAPNPVRNQVPAGPSFSLSDSKFKSKALSSRQAAVVGMLLSAWQRTDLTPTDKMALLAMGWKESSFDPAVRSAPGLADDKQGGSYTIFQLRRDVELAAGMRQLGYTFDQVIPPPGTPIDQLQPYVEKQAMLANWLAKEKGLSRIHAAHGADDELVALDLFVKWAAGGSWDWARVNDAAGPKAYLQNRIPTQSAIQELVPQLRAKDYNIAAGGLARLYTYRELKNAFGVNNHA